MRIVVAGGTGFLGREIAARAVRAGHDVSVLSRGEPRGEGALVGASWVRGDVTRAETLAAALEGADAVVDAVQFPGSPIENPRKGYTFERVDYGGTHNLIEAAKAAGAGRFIDLSGAGAAADAPYHWQRLKWQAEQELMASGLRHTIFRPSWVYGPGDVSLNRFLGFARWLPFVPIIGNGRTRINPLFVADLAEHVAASLQLPAAENRLFEIGGPEELTMDEVVRTALRVSGRRRFLVHQPNALMKLAAGVLQHVPGRPLTPGAVDFITADGVVDSAELVAAFGLRLTPLEEALATYLA